MARFSGDWEKEFRPQWELTKAKESKGLTGASDPKMKSVSEIKYTFHLFSGCLILFFYMRDERLYARSAKVQEELYVMLVKDVARC